MFNWFSLTRDNLATLELLTSFFAKREIFLDVFCFVPFCSVALAHTHSRPSPGGMHCRLAGRPTVASARSWWALPSTNQRVMCVSLSCLVLDSNETRILAKTVQVTNILSKKITTKRKNHNNKEKSMIKSTNAD